MAGRLLTSIDRSLTLRARANAAAAVRLDQQHAAHRREAQIALLAQSGLRAGGAREARVPFAQ